MAKLGDLVVRIGANTKDLNKKLGKVQRDIRSMNSNFTRLGQSMTRSLTLPIAAFGAAAIKSAADLEQLETSFVSLTGGAKEAAFMMERLNEFTAKTPFQIDAVAKSARQLIASGTEISDVNEQLQFLGDIAATSGNSISDIAAIFAKVNAKGKVELENLNQLAERGIPIFTALAEATGLPANALGAGAVSVDQFNETLKSFAEEGGFAAGAMERMSETATGKFSTAMDNIKIALASIGEAFLPMVNAILDGIISMSKAFGNLSPFVKRVAIVTGTFVAAVGPLLIIVPQLVSVVIAMRGAMLALNLAMLANPAVAVAAGIAALAAVVIGYNVDVGHAVQTTNDWRMELLSLNNEGKKIELEKRIASATDAIEEHTKILEKFRKLRDAAKLPSEQMKWQRAMDSHQEIIDGINAELSDYNMELKKVDKALRDAAAAQNKMDDASAQMMQTMDGTKTSLSELLGELDEMAGGTVMERSLNELFTGLDKLQVKAKETEEVFFEMGDVIRQALTGIANAFDGTGNFLSKGLSLLGDLMVSIGNQMVALATSMLQFRKFLISNPALALVAGAGFIIAGQALANIAQSQVEAPALANGGVAFGPTMALIGDNKNASIDPEVVAPLSKLRDMMGGNQVEVYGRISGNDIYLSNNRAGTSRNRYA
jgi:tape measure domain-containing protein